MILSNIMIKHKNKNRTALLIHCSQEEADRIREGAARERRSISGFVLNAVLWRLDVEHRVAVRREARQAGKENARPEALLPGN